MEIVTAKKEDLEIFAEKKILELYECVQIDASFPAKRIYLKRGYKEIEYNIIKTDNGDCLCYGLDIMKAMISPSESRRNAASDINGDLRMWMCR